MGITFRDFFFKTIARERTELFQPHPFRKIFEMALGSIDEPDVVRKPVNIDEDDIQFLQQFPHEFWVRALEMRYHRLFERLEQYNKTKQAAGHDVLANAIYEAIRKQDEKSWHDLLRIGHEVHDQNEHIQLSKEHIENLKKKYPADLTETWTDTKCHDRADMEADEHLKTIFPHLPESEVESFDFIDNRFDFEKGRLGGSNRNKKKVHIEARPYLNRLYHKLERTEGLDHLEGSGLEQTKAKYGFMLRGSVRSHNIEEHPHSTAGMKFPTFDQMKDRVQEFMVQNSHRVFGEIDGPDVVWKPTVFQDTETVKYYKVTLQKQFEQELANEFRRQEQLANDGDEDAQKYIHAKENSTQGERRKQAAKLAHDTLVEMARAGQLKGPPIGATRPGGEPLAPNGLPVKVENGKLVNPQLYLPYKQKTIKFRKPDGTVEEKLEWVPVVKPGKFYRKIEAGEEVPEERRMGFRKNYVHVSDDANPYASGVQRDAALDFNHNTESLRYLGDLEKRDAERFIFSPQQQVVFHNNGLVSQPDSGFYEDIMEGIIQCAQSCSGITVHETMIMLLDIYDIHACIVQSMLRDLAGHEDRFDTAQKRKRYAYDKASLYSQKDLGEGGGTRRLRAFVQKVRDERMATGTPYGARNLDTRGHRNAYKLQNFRAIMQEINQLQSAAAQVDAQSKRMIALSKENIGNKISNNLKQIMSKRGDILMQVIQVLSLAHQFKHKSDEKQAEQWATDQTRSWVELGVDTTELVNLMMNLDIVKAITDEVKNAGDDPTDQMSLQKNPGLNDEIRSAIQIAKHDLHNQLMMRGNNPNDPIIVQRFKSELPELSQYVKDNLHGGLAQQLAGEFQWLTMSGNEEELRKVLTAAQQEINTILSQHR